MKPLAIAHRAGNSLSALRGAVELGADVLEADVHAFRGRLEVRHSKSLGPLPWLWDKWELTSTSLAQLQLGELLAATDAGPTLMLDLKGAGGVGIAVAEALRRRHPERPVLVCSRWWPGVDAFAGQRGVRPVLTARTRVELQRLRHHVRSHAPYGVSLHRSLLTAAVVAELSERVELVMTWPVNDTVALREVLARGVTGVISDEAEILQAVLSYR